LLPGLLRQHGNRNAFSGGAGRGRLRLRRGFGFQHLSATRDELCIGWAGPYSSAKRSNLCRPVHLTAAARRDRTIAPLILAILFLLRSPCPYPRPLSFVVPGMRSHQSPVMVVATAKPCVPAVIESAAVGCPVPEGCIFGRPCRREEGSCRRENVLCRAIDCRQHGPFPQTVRTSRNNLAPAPKIRCLEPAAC